MCVKEYNDLVTRQRKKLIYCHENFKLHAMVKTKKDIFLNKTRF
jgi:hypothetical protein